MVSIMTEFKQLDIYWVDLEPTKGAETKKLRPCVIVQGDLVNIQSKTLIVAPMLPNHKSWPFAVNLTPTSNNGLDKDRHINLKQLRALISLELAKSKVGLRKNICNRSNKL
jgi:mRNA interferase MazF